MRLRFNSHRICVPFFARRLNSRRERRPLSPTSKKPASACNCYLEAKSDSFRDSLSRSEDPACHQNPWVQFFLCLCLCLFLRLSRRAGVGRRRVLGLLLDFLFSPTQTSQRRPAANPPFQLAVFRYVSRMQNHEGLVRTVRSWVICSLSL